MASIYSPLFSLELNHPCSAADANKDRWFAPQMDFSGMVHPGKIHSTHFFTPGALTGDALLDKKNLNSPWHHPSTLN